MKSLIKRRWFIYTGCALILLGLAALIVLCVPKPTGQKTLAATPGKSPAPEPTCYAEVSSGEEMSEQELYGAYSHENDPAHPVLDVQVSLQISNLGSRPGAPRPQDIALEYGQAGEQPASTPPATSTPSATLKPGIVLPGLKPDIHLPDVTLPELYILNPEVENPCFAGDSFTLEWKYTGGRKVTFAISISADKGESFDPLATGLSGEKHTLIFPDIQSEHCILRVSAMLDGREYKTADTSVFAVAAAPVPAPTPIAGYVDTQVRYVDVPGLRLSSESGLPVWFKAENHAAGAAKLIWQLSKAPFVGTKESFGQEGGMLASGEVATAGSEFSVDLKTLCEALSKPDSERVTDQPFLPRQSVYEFHLRVVALDENGKCIGDPGRGLSFMYGAPDIASFLQSDSIAETSDIKILMETPVPYTSNQYTWKRINPDIFNADLGDVSDRVLFSASGLQEASAIIQKAVRVELQVATSPYSNAASLGFAKPAGLVYSSLDTAPDIGQSSDGYTYLTPWNHGIEYKQFVPTKDELDAMGGIYYYVRAVFFVPDAGNPSALRPYPSETLTVAFRVTAAFQNEVKKVAVRSDIPYVQFWKYTPVKWQYPNYDEYYEVARHIDAKEMNFSVRCPDGFRIPNFASALQQGWTLENYQALLDERLPVGAVIHYVKAEPGFWDEFFSLLSDIYSGVSNAYANAKASVVSLVDYIPLIGDDARAYLKTAATYAIDYGLASIGLPPTLPNIDQLAEGGMDYIMKVAVAEALQAAGVPVDSPAAQEITDQVRGQVAGEITDEMKKAVLAQNQNPLKAGFLRLDTKKLYEPAYVDVFVCNYSKTRATRAGQLLFNSGNGFDVYKTRCVPIPELQPGEHVTIRVYLDHLRNKYAGYNQYFDELYNGNSGKPYKMAVYTQFQLPDVIQEAKKQGLAPAPLPYVTEYVYDHGAYSYRYEREFVPAEGIYEPDSAPNAQEFLD